MVILQTRNSEDEDDKVKLLYGVILYLRCQELS